MHLKTALDIQTKEPYIYLRPQVCWEDAAWKRQTPPAVAPRSFVPATPQPLQQCHEKLPLALQPMSMKSILSHKVCWGLIVEYNVAATDDNAATAISNIGGVLGLVCLA